MFKKAFVGTLMVMLIATTVLLSGMVVSQKRQISFLQAENKQWSEDYGELRTQFWETTYEAKETKEKLDDIYSRLKDYRFGTVKTEKTVQ